MSARFFNPWVGSNYWAGLGSNAYCVLVLGASVYCNRNWCPYFYECTSEDAKDSSDYNDQCPYPETDDDGQDTLLEDYPSHVYSNTITTFTNKMNTGFRKLLDGGDVWDYVAFTEYVQYFLSHKKTYPDDLSDRDFDSFLETLDELRPDVVVVWGDVVASSLRDSEYTVDADDDDPWDFAWDYDDMFIRFICCPHPASRSYFHNNFSAFANKFKETICS